jgi:hypothetical protein
MAPDSLRKSLSEASFSSYSIRSKRGRTPFLRLFCGYRRWQRGQKWVERLATMIRLIGAAQDLQGSPVLP